MRIPGHEETRPSAVAGKQGTETGQTIPHK